MYIIPAIIPRSYRQLEEDLSKVVHAAPRVQVDVMDGVYTPKASWPYNGVEHEAFEALEREEQGFPYWKDIDFEIDLMVQKPEACIEEWSRAGAVAVIIHVESTQTLSDTIAQCENIGLEVALALKPTTDLEVLAPFIERVSFVQCMGNDQIGQYGVPLDSAVLDKIRAIKMRWPLVTIGVDIGVSERTIPKLVEAGAVRFAAGSSVFGNEDAKASLQKLEEIASKAFTSNNS